jgi:hypothetical protein
MRMILPPDSYLVLFKLAGHTETLPLIVRAWHCLCSSAGLIVALRIRYKDFPNGLTKTEGYSR